MTNDQSRRLGRSLTSLAYCLVGCLLVALAGCSSGPPHYKIKGKVVDGDKAVLPDPNSSINISFVPVVEAGQPANASAAMLDAQDGSFEILGNELIGMPAGKYKVKMMSMSPSPSALSKFINARFNDSTPIVIDVVDDKTPLVIDIAPYKKK